MTQQRARATIAVKTTMRPRRQQLTGIGAKGECGSRQLQTSFIDSGNRNSPITAADSAEKCKRTLSQTSIEPRRLRMVWIAERGDNELMVTSIWQINCDILEKADKCLAVNADSKGMYKRAQMCTIKIRDFCEFVLF